MLNAKMTQSQSIEANIVEQGSQPPVVGGNHSKKEKQHPLQPPKKDDIIDVTWLGNNGGTFRCKVIETSEGLDVASANNEWEGSVDFYPNEDKWEAVQQLQQQKLPDGFTQGVPNLMKHPPLPSTWISGYNSSWKWLHRNRRGRVKRARLIGGRRTLRRRRNGRRRRLLRRRMMERRNRRVVEAMICRHPRQSHLSLPQRHRRCNFRGDRRGDEYWS
jgi:hypothetical protein